VADERRVALLDGIAAPDVLVEARTLEPPPATGGNRFLTGWTAERVDGVRLLRVDARGARLEGVHLGTAPRRLVIALAPPVVAGTMEVSIAGGATRRVPFAPRVEVPLPAGLRHGRFLVDLGFPAGPPAHRAPLLRGAGFDRALPAGAVTVAGSELRQSGVSRVELVRPLAGEATLVGELMPPASGRARQRFDVRVLSGGRDRLLWSFQPRWWRRGTQQLRLPVRGEGGFLRLALEATANGPPATWRGLALVPAPHGDAAARDDGSSAPGAAADAASTPAHGAVAAAAAKLASSPGPPPAPKLVILYVFDALRADAVGARAPDGTSATPTLDGLGAEGARFAAHFAVAPNTLPSTKALLTGRVWRQRGGVPLGAAPATLAERFRAAGYRTGLFSGNVWVSRAYGVDRGFEAAPESTIFGADAEKARPYNDNAEAVHRAALDWLATLPPDARAFVYLHVVHPHNPYRPPAALRARFDDGHSGTLDGSSATLLALSNRRLAASAADQRRIRALYHAGLAYADDELGRFLAALRSRYAPEQTLLAITADHGEELFDHGGVLHGYTVYDEMLHIPLLLSWPGRLPARSVTELTDTVDLHRALAALVARDRADAGRLWTMLGTAEPSPQHAARDALRDPERELRLAAAASVRGGIYAARTSRYKVVWAPRTGGQWGMGHGPGRSRDPEYVFDLRADPLERRNLAGLAVPEVLWLRARLLAWAAGAEADEGDAAPVDAETRARLRALGYVD
jgi:arylsulfatase A-like enzyme